MGRHCAMLRSGTSKTPQGEPIEVSNVVVQDDAGNLAISWNQVNGNQVHLLLWDEENPEQMLKDEYILGTPGANYYDSETGWQLLHVYKASVQYDSESPVESAPWSPS